MIRGVDQKRQIGQAMVEFALTLPVLLLMILGTIDFGRILFTYAQVSNSHRIALRQAEILGNGGSSAPFLDCDHLEELAQDVLMVTPEVHIRYIKATTASSSPTFSYDCDSSTSEPAPSIANLSSGDLLQIEVTAEIGFLFLPFGDLELNFLGQRTIIKTLPIGDLDGNDSDFDGLDDGWECIYFYSGTCLPPNNLPPDDDLDEMLALQNATGNPDGDDCNNGCEEGRGSNPNRASPRRSSNLVAVADCDTGAVTFSWVWGTDGVVLPDRGEIYNTEGDVLVANVTYPDTTCTNCDTISAGVGFETEAFYYMISFKDYTDSPPSSEPTRSSNVARASTFVGECSPTSADISGSLWVDADNDGFIDGDETLAQAGETITISDVPFGGSYATYVTTDSYGFYSFLNLPAGTYEITAPPNLSSPYATPSKYNRNGTAYDWTTPTLNINVTAGNDVTIDFGYR